MQSQTSASGPELRGSNITLEAIKTPSNVSNRKTKIICTLGPACWDVPTLESLIDAGMNVARFNFSHGDHAGHKACLDRLRQAAKNKNAHIGKFYLYVMYGCKLQWRMCSYFMYVLCYPIVQITNLYNTSTLL